MKEADIRPAELMDRYLALSREDAETMLGDPTTREESPCPGCGAADGPAAFEKHGFTFRECPGCGTLFVSPRPTGADLDRFYRESPSSRFWATDFFPTVADARRERIIRPRAERVAEHRLVAGLGDARVIDVGAGAGAFLDELRSLRPGWSYTAVEPGLELAEQCRAAGLEVVERPGEEATELEGAGDVVTSFEVIEHVHD